MKRIFIVVALFVVALFAFVQPTYAVEEPTVIESTLIEDIQTNEMVVQILSWVGGFSGLAALGAFGLRFIKDRKVMSKVMSAVNKVALSNEQTVSNVNQMILSIQGDQARRQVLEKAVVGVISMSSMDAGIKASVIEQIQNETIDLNHVVNLALDTAKLEKENNETLMANIEKSTQSLLEQLSRKA